MKLYEDHPLMMQGAPPMSEPIAVTYLDLERLIQTAGLTSMQLRIVDLIMMGWTERDISEVYGGTREGVAMMFKRAVEKIVRKNNEEWKRVWSKKTT